MAEEQPHTEAAAPAVDMSGIYLLSSAKERLYQGELVECVVEWRPGYDEANHDIVASTIPTRHSLALILSQDCDLEQDYVLRRHDVWAITDLTSVLLCPAFPADELRKLQNLTSRKWESVRQNKDERYAYLAEVPQASDASREGHPAILLDLVNYFTVPTPELYRQLRLAEAKPRCRLETPWREHMQLRFAIHLARIGLPRDHFVPESRKPAPLALQDEKSRELAVSPPDREQPAK